MDAINVHPGEALQEFLDIKEAEKKLSAELSKIHPVAA